MVVGTTPTAEQRSTTAGKVARTISSEHTPSRIGVSGSSGFAVIFVFVTQLFVGVAFHLSASSMARAPCSNERQTSLEYFMMLNECEVFQMSDSYEKSDESAEELQLRSRD